MFDGIKTLKVYPKLAFNIILLLLVLIIASAMVSSRLSSSAIQKETEYANLLFLNKLNKIVENEIQHMNDALARFCHKNLYDENISQKILDPYEQYKLFDNINELLENNRYIHSVHLFYNQGEDVFYQTYQHSGRVKSEDFYDMEIYNSYIAENKLSMITGTRFIHPDYTGTGSKEQDYARVFSFINRIPPNTVNTQNVVIFNIYSDYLEKLAESSLIPEESKIFVFDSYGEILISYDQQTDSSAQLDYGDMAALKSKLADGDSYSMLVGNEKCYVTDIKSDTGKRYILMIPEDVVFRQIHVMNRTLIYFSASLLLFGILFSALIDRKFFQPVLDILHHLSSGKAEGPEIIAETSVPADEQGGNITNGKRKAKEFRQIESYINTMISKNRDQGKQLESYFLYYRERVIHALMNNDRQTVEMLEDDRLLFNRNYKCFSLILVYSGRQKSTSTEEEHGETATDYLVGCLTGIIDKLGQVEKITVAPQKTALLLCMESERTASDIARHIRENIMINDSDTGIAVGCVCASMKHISKSYADAEGLLQNFSEEQEFQVLDNSIIKERPGYEYRCPEKNIDEMIEAVRQRDYVILEKQLGSLFQQMRATGVSLKKMKKRALVLIYRICTEAGDALNQRENALFMDNIFDEMESLRTVNALESWMKEMFRNFLYDPYAAADSINNNDLIDKVIGFINTHYMEDIGLNTIADYVYFSPSYLGKVFKEVSGYNFSDYVIKVRMEKAAQLIKCSKAKLTDIMEKVGYYSIQGFSRVFKSYFRCSPGEYRKKYAYSSLSKESDVNKAESTV